MKFFVTFNRYFSLESSLEFVKFITLGRAELNSTPKKVNILETSKTGALKEGFNLFGYSRYVNVIYATAILLLPHKKIKIQDIQ